MKIKKKEEEEKMEEKEKEEGGLQHSKFEATEWNR